MLLNFHAAQEGGAAAQSRLSALSMAAPGGGLGYGIAVVRGGVWRWCAAVSW